MMRVKEEPVFAVNGGNTSRGAKFWRSPSHSEERERSCYKCGEYFRMIIRVVRLQVISVKYACVDIIRIFEFCSQQSHGKGNFRFIGTQ